MVLAAYFLVHSVLEAIAMFVCQESTVGKVRAAPIIYLVQQYRTQGTYLRDQTRWYSKNVARSRRAAPAWISYAKKVDFYSSRPLVPGNLAIV